jgi:hypothetical protein
MKKQIGQKKRPNKKKKKKKNKTQLGQKQETAQQQQKKIFKNKNPDLRSKLSNPKNNYPLSMTYNRRTHHV